MFNKLHFKIEYFLSFIKRRFLIILVTIGLICCAILFRKQIINFVNLPIFKKETIGVDSFYTIKTMPDDIADQISYGLTTNSKNDKATISPIVESLSIENENKDYIFTLKDNIFWHNGKKLIASDIDYSSISGIKVTVLSENKIKISLEKEFSPILSVLSQPLLKKNTIGLGSYKIKKYSLQDGYLKTLYLTPTKDNLPQKVYRFYQDEDDLINAYKLGDVSEIKITSLPEDLSKSTNNKISPQIETDKKYSAIFFNTQKISSKQLRQALAYATPKTKGDERCLGPISPESWAYNPDVKDYDFDANHAQELFQNNKIDSINLVVGDRRLLSVAEDIKKSWESVLGIKTEITTTSQIDTENFDAILTYGSIPHDPDQYLFWHSTQIGKSNLTKLNDSRIDKLLEDGRFASDQVERKSIYQDFQKYLLEESPAIFLSYPTTYTITRLK